MKHTNKGSLILIAICVIILCAATAVGICLNRCDRSTDVPTVTGIVIDTAAPDTEAGQPFDLISFGDGITVTNLFSYTGLFVEDGSDTTVSGVAACSVENNGTKPIQLLVFSLYAQDGSRYVFELSTLLPGQKVNVIEKSATPLDLTDVGFTAELEQYALFTETPSLHPEELQIFCSGNTIRLTNLTDTTMQSCRLYFKYKQNGTYIGGITFSVKVTDLAPEEPVTVSPSHYAENNCEILFVTYE